ncbi:MAG: ribonucleoside-triphosphate reductase, adenosylcobalamin-dependent [Anaerocolumna sp.]|nr:ribonucleoside-triphosphate reductase, adenosylcobalamin-dependent [Anaerocolumna sp.]
MESKNKTIIKRNGKVVDFDRSRIANAIYKAMISVGEENKKVADDIAAKIEENFLEGMRVEDVERQVVKELFLGNLDKVADSYADYKAQRKLFRSREAKDSGKFLSGSFIAKYKHTPDPFPNELGKFVYYRTYSRPIPEERRREYWWETCFRVVEFNVGLQLDAMRRQGIEVTEKLMAQLTKEAEEIYELMYHLKLFPSGRSLWIAGSKASYLYPLSNFNCSFVTIDDLEKFSEIFFVLMLGTGVGLSVQREYVSKLPKINSKIDIIHKAYEAVPANLRKEYTELKLMNNNALEIEIGDSKFGWSNAINMFFDVLSSKQYIGIEYIFFNYNNVRPEGERLRTFGGYASGHNNIKQMFSKINEIFKEKRKVNHLQWQTIKPIDCLDIATIIAENVVSGGVRRSAEIILCDNDDEEVLNAKANLYYQDDSGNWIENKKILNRSLSNNTVIYKEKPTREELHDHFSKLKVSGEPAFANFEEMRRRRNDVQGGNPCFEILLRDRGVCNLTEVNLMGFVKEDGTFDKEALLKTQSYSARIGYRMASIELELHEWNLVNEEDRLTGCSLTGVMDFRNATNMSDEDFIALLKELKQTAREAAFLLADFLRMNRPKLVTTVKPSGTISQLPTVSSGVHFSHSPYYIRRVRVNAKDPLAQALAAAGFRWNPEVGQSLEEHKTKVFEFPVKAPEGRTKYDVSALEQLELYKMIMKNYVDHNASNTIHVRPKEWDEVEQWVYDNWDDIVGVTFLSLDDSFYQLLPYEAITKEQYEELYAKQPRFNPSILKQYETFEEEFDILDADCDSGVCPVR